MTVESLELCSGALGGACDGVIAWDVGVIGGAGRVGLPLALSLADVGFRVLIVDLNIQRLELLRSGRMPFLEAGAPELLARILVEHPERLSFQSDCSETRFCRMLVLTVGTPVDKHLNPQFTPVERCLEWLRPHLTAGQTLIFRSTVFPGTSARVLAMLKHLDISVSFCPERIRQGLKLAELRELPALISGADSRALAHARELFERLGKVTELTLAEAEVAKLFFNSWRYVLFGIANQFYQIVAAKDMDFHKIFAAITYKYPRARNFPRSGFTAGPCLFKDTMQLAAYCRHTFSLGHAAMLVNETMPDTVMDQAIRSMGKPITGVEGALAGVHCGILGMAFKPNHDNSKESLAFKLRRLLLWEGAKVLCSDPYIHEEGFVSVEKLLKESELVFIGCPHEVYRAICFEARHRVFDCWGLSTKPRLTITPKADCMEAKPLHVAIIGGAGHVGLPLSLVLADRGCCVVVIDMDAEKMKRIQTGQLPFLEHGGEELLRHCLDTCPDRLSFHTDYSVARACDVVIVTIGTPVDEHLNPHFSVVEACMRRLCREALREGQTLILRSTLFPGTSSLIEVLLREEGFNDVGVSFCPERIAQGFALTELTKLPQIISGSSPRALEHARCLFGRLQVELVELELREAEIAKLFLNAWRYVDFAIANQLYQIAFAKGLNFDKIRHSLVYDYPHAREFPRSGFTAGPCLFKDTMQLAAYCRHTFSLGHAAMLVNETMPDCVFEMAKRAMAKRGLTLFGKPCAILGMAFKPDNDDDRESLAFKLRRLLRRENHRVVCTDIYIKRDGFVSIKDALAQCDVVLVGCPHKEYKSISFEARHCVIDCWGFYTRSDCGIKGDSPSKRFRVSSPSR